MDPKQKHNFELELYSVFIHAALTTIRNNTPYEDAFQQLFSCRFEHIAVELKQMCDKHKERC